MKKLLEEIAKWQDETFPDATVGSKIHHLIQEIRELFEDQDSEEEYVDCFLLLWGAWAKSGRTYEQLIEAIKSKMKINKSRKWGKPDANGVVNHIEP